jgi:hypothetical protein
MKVRKVYPLQAKPFRPFVLEIAIDDETDLATIKHLIEVIHVHHPLIRAKRAMKSDRVLIDARKATVPDAKQEIQHSGEIGR